MKKLYFTTFLMLSLVVVDAQNDRVNVLQDLEKDQVAKQSSSLTATLKSASRLFAEKDDITAVILIIPSGSVVDVIGSDSTYLQVVYEDNQGYIYRRHAVLNKPPVPRESVTGQKEVAPEQKPTIPEEVSRFVYLENKYGSKIAPKLMAGKIWKGMTSEMIRDSWGKPQKINRVISGNIIKEEWIYMSTWLYIENDLLFEWGPVK